MIKTQNSTSAANCQAFLTLFNGRRDAVPKHYDFTTSDGDRMQGYVPICDLTGKPDCAKNHSTRTSCTGCPERVLVPMSENLVKRHLNGNILLGIYPLMSDNTCHFIAADFDNHETSEGDRDPLSDVRSFHEVCDVNEISCHIERSRSGNGYHAWIFFESAVPSWKARAVTFAMLQEAQVLTDNEKIHTFDRLFPNQDEHAAFSLGFGNLIALPLHKKTLLQGNSAFMSPDSGFSEPEGDQWGYIDNILINGRVSESEIDNIVSEWDLSKTPVNAGTGSGSSVNNDSVLDMANVWNGLSAGERNDQVFRYACRLRSQGLSLREAESIIKNVWDIADNNGFPWDEAVRCLESAFRYPGPEEEKPDFNLTDLGNAKRLCHLYGDDIRFLTENKAWMSWNGLFWDIDTDEVNIQQKAEAMLATIPNGNLKELVAEQTNLVESSGNTKRLKDLKFEIQQEKKRVKFAFDCENNRRFSAIIKLCKNRPGVPILISKLDKNPWLINSLNGTVDLKTGKMKDPDRMDYQTKELGAEFVSGAECPHWLNFLNEIFDKNEDLIRFIQKAVGYSLTGDITEECMFILIGNGGNGKGTFISTLKHMFGRYSATADFSTTFAPLKNQNDASLNALAMLKGSRFVDTSETEEGIPWKEPIIKSSTAPDGEICGRMKYGNIFSFMPEFKIWLASNYKPVVKGTDEGIWRRLRLINFNKEFRGVNRDNGLKKRLQTELTGILQWAVKGCLMWQKEGLTPPLCVMNDTADYRSEMAVNPLSDLICEFFDITGSESDFLSSSEIVTHLKVFGHSMPLSRKTYLELTKAMKNLPQITKGKHGPLNGFFGVRKKMQSE